MSVINAETDIIASIAASPIRRAVIIYVETFKTGVNVFICNVTTCFTSHWMIVLVPEPVHWNL